MNKSIAKKLFALMMLFSLLLIVFLWSAISLGSEEYYLREKISEINKYSSTVSEIYTQGHNEAKVFEDIESALRGFSGEVELLLPDNKSVLFGRGRFGRGPMNMSNTVIELIPSKNTPDNVSIAKIKPRMGTMEVLLYKTLLPDGAVINFMTTYQEIEAAVQIIKRFFVFISFFAILFALSFSYIFSRSISRPLLRLSVLAKELENLNFSARYLEKREDEIGELGRVFNSLSARLEKTITDLQEELHKEKSLDSLRKKFIAQVSHELQTPLSVINGYMGGLRDKIFDSEEEEKEYYLIIEQEISKMSSLVKDLLDLSSMESEGFVISKEETELSLLLEEIQKKHLKLFTENGLQLELLLKEKEAKISIDRRKIEQAIRNLLANANKYAEKDSQVILELDSTNNKEYKISVKNTGKTIDQTEIGLIWKPFYKGSQSVAEGNGLGLGIVAKIISLHDGRVFARQTGEKEMEIGFYLYNNALLEEERESDNE